MTTTAPELSYVIKNARIEKGYTQLELAELTGISLRSIQRIENGKVTPRNYTLKVLSEKLGIVLPEIKLNAVPHRVPMATAKKTIISLCVALLCMLLGGAYLSQAGSFPETNFEYLMFWSLVTICYAAAMFRFWR